MFWIRKGTQNFCGLNILSIYTYIGHFNCSCNRGRDGDFKSYLDNENSSFISRKVTEDSNSCLSNFIDRRMQERSSHCMSVSQFWIPGLQKYKSTNFCSVEIIQLLVVSHRNTKTNKQKKLPQDCNSILWHNM